LTPITYLSLPFPLRCCLRATLTILQLTKAIHYSINSLCQENITVFHFTKD
jgi:hypothetical protein